MERELEAFQYQRRVAHLWAGHQLEAFQYQRRVVLEAFQYQ